MKPSLIRVGVFFVFDPVLKVFNDFITVVFLGIWSHFRSLQWLYQSRFRRPCFQNKFCTSLMFIWNMVWNLWKLRIDPIEPNQIPQFYIQIVNRPHFGTGILLFGPFGQSGQQWKKVDFRNSEQLLRLVFSTFCGQKKIRRKL